MQVCRNLIIHGILVLLILLSSVYPSELQNIADSKYWHLLMHYRSTIWGVKSELDGPDFFLSPQGKYNPLEELKATLESFSKDLKIGKIKQHPQCAFRARFHFLKEKLNLAIKEVPCNSFEQWKNGLKTKSLSLIFASSYPNNPASFFGHTFLKLNAQQGSKLLDYGLNFAAATNDDLGITFGLLGLLGGYKGAFSILPYYLKVNEYNNIESRDLWEYKLKLNAKQIDRLLMHLWELAATSYFDYYFLDENCSYQLLSLLEVANPKWNLVKDFPMQVVPAETVKSLARNKALEAPLFRPSLKRKYYAALKKLGKSEWKQFLEIVKGKKLPKNPQQESLDLAVMHLNYNKFRSVKDFASKDQNLLYSLLLQRSKMKRSTHSKKDITFTKSRPDFSHATANLNLSLGYYNGESYFEPGYWYGSHELLNDDFGYPPYIQFSLGGIKFRHLLKSKKTLIQRIDFLKIVSLFPYEPLNFSPSWMVDLNYDDKIFSLSAGLGAAFYLWSENQLLYLFANAQNQLGKYVRKNRKFYLNPEIGIVTRGLYRLQVLLRPKWEIGYLNGWAYLHYEFNQAVSLSKDLELKLSLNFNQKLKSDIVKKKYEYFSQVTHFF